MRGFTKLFMGLMLLSGTAVAQELKVDFGNGKRHADWKGMQANGSAPYMNAFGSNKHATLTVKGAAWKRNPEQLEGETSSQGDLLDDYCGIMRKGIGGIKLELPAGLYNVAVFHHQSSASRPASALLTLKDAAGERRQTVESGFGKAPSSKEVRQVFSVESNGSDPITFVYRNQSLGSIEFPMNGIAIVADTPESYVGSFEYEGKNHEYHVRKINLRGPDFKLEAQTGPREFVTQETGLVRTYVGYVKDHPSMMVAGYLRPDGTFRGGVYWERFARRLEFVGNQTVQVEMLEYPLTFEEPRRQFLQGGRMDAGVYQFMVGVEIPYKPFAEGLDSDFEKTLETVEFSAVQVAALYLRDAKLFMKINRIVVRASQADDPFEKTPDGGRSLMASLWKDAGSHLSSVDYDKLLFVGGSSASLGGLTASTGVTKGSYPRMDLIWRHEMLHTFNPRNDEGGYPEGGTVMVRYRVMNRISSTEMEAVANYRDKKQGSSQMFDILGDLAAPLPPYGNYDFVRVIKGAKTAVRLDVLANDHDVNGDALTIKAFDEKSLFGATIKRAKGAGPRKRDLLIYQPPAHKTGTDYFFYTVTDGLFEFKAVVVVDVQPPHRIYEAEQATHTGKKKAGGSLQTGTGYILLSDQQSITWSVDGKNGVQGLKIRYGNLNTDPIPLELYLNGERQGTLQAYPTGKRAEWRHIVLPQISLKPGKNKIRLLSRSSGKEPINIDHLMVYEGTDIRINFSGDLAEERPDQAWHGSYCHDWGRAFGDRGPGAPKYGWNTDVNDWEICSINQVAAKDLGSCIRMQKKSKKTWEIELPNGNYHVTIMCGSPDPERKGHINNLTVENVHFTDPDGKDQLDLYEGKVSVRDGRLTVKPGPKAVDARICYIWIAK